MKKTILILTFLFLYGSVSGQCPPGDVTLSSQQNIDDFVATYPNCTAINGHLKIGQDNSTTFDVVDLSGLSQITKVAENLEIRGNGALISLEGLGQLDSVGYDIRIQDNANIANIEDLSGITEVGGSLVVITNPNLTSLYGLHQITSITYVLHITNNDALPNLEGLNQVANVGTHIYIEGNLALATLDGLDNLTSLGYGIKIRGNTALNDISAIETTDLSAINNLRISYNPNLQMCSYDSICDYLMDAPDYEIHNNDIGCNSYNEVSEGCHYPVLCSDATLRFYTQQQVDEFALYNPDCTDISGSVLITSSEISPITNLNRLSQINSISEDLIIRNNAALNDLNGLTALTGIGRDLYIETNGLTSLSGLENITTISRDFVLRGNYLSDLNGLNNLSSIGSSFTLSSTTSLEDISALTNLHTIGHSLIITDCDQLTNLTGLENITTISNSLWISQNDGLVDFTGLNNLNTIANFWADNNPNLTSFNGLQNLGYIDESLNISYNSVLNDITALNDTDLPDTASLGISNNPNLAFCSIESVCEHYNNGGYLYITFNATGCYNYFQILDGCDYTPDCSNSILVFAQSHIDEFPLNNPDCITINGDVEIIGATVSGITPINNLDGLAQITSISGDLIIRDNDGLLNFNGFQQLQTIGGDLIIRDNDTLISLSGLENLTSINGLLSIESNPILTDISALDNIDHTTITNLNMRFNTNLSDCSTELVCNYIVDGGAYSIFLNACSSWLIEFCLGLPVEMVSPLQVRLQNRTALLTWRSATETNNFGFEIQNSKDGINWQRIGWQAGQGTTTTPHTYTHIDENPLTGTSYYRLKQVDFDGQFSYSNIVSLNYSRPQIDIFPNPVKDKLYIHSNENNVDNILIFNMMGQQVDVQFSNNFLDVSQLPAGLYTIKISMDGVYFYEKIVVE